MNRFRPPSTLHPKDRSIGRGFACAGLMLLVSMVSGCATIVETGVTNPVPEMNTVAVAPFFNLSPERAVDGRRFADIYSTELQKVPGLEVIPVGIVEQVALDQQLELNNPADAERLRQALGADALVVGAVTEYSPYYPPRVGMKTVWHARADLAFRPGIPVHAIREEPFWHRVPRYMGLDQVDLPSLPDVGGPTDGNAGSTNSDDCPDEECRDVVRGQSPEIPGETVTVPDPIMAYTRMFDGADAVTTAQLRDYVELRGDLRSGGWEAYLYRSDDFIRFCSHRMILELFTLHGGQSRVRTVVGKRRYGY